MGLYSNNAKLIWFDDTTAIEDVSEKVAPYDGAILKIGESDSLFLDSDKKLDKIYKTGKPTIAFYGMEYSKMYGSSAGKWNGDAWPHADSDLLIKNLNRLLFSGSVLRKYSGLILDISNTELYPNNFFNGEWVWFYCIKYWVDMAWNQYHLPVYLYMTHKSYKDNYKNNSTLPEHFKTITQPDALSSVKFVATNDEGVPNDNDFLMKTWNADTKKFDLDMDTGYWWFWLYKSNPMTWIFNGTKEKLYADLNFVPISIGDEDLPIQEIPNENADPVDGVSVQEILSNQALLMLSQQELKEQIEILSNKFNKHFKEL